jgi:hypothetical protein
MQIYKYSNGVALASVVVTTIAGHVVAGYGNVNAVDVSSVMMEFLSVNSLVNNTTPEEGFLFVSDTKRQTPYSAMTCVAEDGLCLYSGIRLATLSNFCVSYLAFEPITDPVERRRLRECLEEMFVGFDCLLKTHIHGFADSLAIAAHDTAKRVHLEHEEQKTHHFKNAFIAIDHIMKSTTHQNLEPNIRSAMELTTTGILTCMRTKAFSLLQCGEYQPLLQWLNVRDEVARLTEHHSKVEVEAPDGLMLRTDETLLKIILQNLVSNAMEHDRNGGVVSISFSMHSGKALLRVINEPGKCHEAMLETHGPLSKTTPPPDAFLALLKCPSEKAPSNRHPGLNEIKLCLDTLNATMGLYFHAQHVVTEVGLSGDSKFFAKTVFDDCPVIACLDDSAVQRKLMLRMCGKTKAAKGSFSVGASIAEIHAFPAQVVRSLMPVTHCIIDQHLDDPVGNQQSVRETDIAKQLRTLGYTGRCIMRSANDSPASLALYHKCGADTFMSKSSLSPAAFVEALEGKNP